MPEQSHQIKHILVLYPQLFTAPIVNILNPLQHIAEQGLITLDHCREDVVMPQQVRMADVIVTCRSVNPVFKPIYDYAINLGIPIIYDLDDNLFVVPKDSPAYRYFGHPDKQAQLTWLIQHASLVRVHSPTLVDVIKPLNSNVEVVWAAVDWSLAPDELPPLRKPLEIVYAVSEYSGAMFYPLIHDDLAQLLKDYQEQVSFHMLGYKDERLARLDNCFHIPFENDYKAFFRKFTHHGYAIGLAPMKDDLFYECKTDLKYRDYAAAGAVGIYTDSPLFQQVEDHETGLLISNEKGQWYQAIESLLHSPDKLVKMRQSARERLAERYNVEVTSRMWYQDLNKVKRQKTNEDIQHPKQWWFTGASGTERRQKSKLYTLYHRVVPFWLHVRISRIYQAIRKRLAMITKLPS